MVCWLLNTILEGRNYSCLVIAFRKFGFELIRTFSACDGMYWEIGAEHLECLHLGLCCT